METWTVAAAEQVSVAPASTSASQIQADPSSTAQETDEPLAKRQRLEHSTIAETATGSSQTMEQAQETTEHQ